MTAFISSQRRSLNARSVKERDMKCARDWLSRIIAGAVVVAIVAVVGAI